MSANMTWLRTASPQISGQRRVARTVAAPASSPNLEGITLTKETASDNALGLADSRTRRLRGSSRHAVPRRAAPPRHRPLPPPPQGRLSPLPHACRADGRIARCSDGLFRTATRASSGTTRGPQCSASAARTTAPVQAALAHHPSPPSSAVGRGADAPGSRPASAHTRIPQRLPTRALPTGRRRVRVAWNGRAPHRVHGRWAGEGHHGEAE